MDTLLQKKLAVVRATQPAYDGDELTKVTAYLKLASELLSEIRALKYFRGKPGIQNKLQDINMRIDNLFYDTIQKMSNGGH